MIGKTPRRAGRVVAALFITASVSAVGVATASASEAIYNNMPSPKPAAVVSLGYEATSTSEFGGLVKFGKTARKNPTVSVMMDSWACQSGSWNAFNCATTPGSKFEVPITVSVYELGPGNTVGAKIAAGSKTFKLPYRPSANLTRCTGANTGYWYSKGSCHTSVAAKATLALKVAKLPEEAIISVSYNTSNYGATPTKCNEVPAANCPEDSLNVGVEDGFAPPQPAPTVGSQPLPEGAFLSSTWSGAYECGGPTGTFRLDACGWKEFQPLFEVKATS